MARIIETEMNNVSKNGKNALRSALAAGLVASLLLLSPAAASAQGFGGGGYSGPGPNIATVAQTKSMGDDEYVALRGNIVQHLGDDHYLFRDASGTVTVEIDNDLWYGVQVQQGDLIEIQGEVDRDWNRVEIDVKRIVKVQ